MENNEITISIICRKDRVNAANEAPLYLRINKGQQKKLLSLKLQIPIMYWDFENNKTNSDIQDTEDSKKIKRYQFNLYALGEEI